MQELKPHPKGGLSFMGAMHRRFKQASSCWGDCLTQWKQQQQAAGSVPCFSCCFLDYYEPLAAVHFLKLPLLILSCSTSINYFELFEIYKLIDGLGSSYCSFMQVVITFNT